MRTFGYGEFPKPCEQINKMQPRSFIPPLIKAQCKSDFCFFTQGKSISMERQYSSIEEDYIVVAPQEAGETPQEYCAQDESR